MKVWSVCACLCMWGCMAKELYKAHALNQMGKTLYKLDIYSHSPHNNKKTTPNT